MRPGPQVYVQTRGRARAADYAFLCGAPPHPWWRTYREATAFDHPTVLVHADGGGWVAYLSGIPSARVDAVGTVVRYTLVLEGPPGDGYSADGPVVAGLLAAVAAWLDDVAEGLGGRPGRRLSAALDAALPPDDVQRWIDADAPPPVSPASDSSVVSEPGRRVLRAFSTLPTPDVHAGGPPGSWVGGVASPQARASFLGRVADLTGGARGRALLLNLVGPDDLAPLLDPASPVAVLVEGARSAHPEPLRAVVEAKKAAAPPDGAAPAQPATAPSWSAGATAVAMTALAVVVTVLAAVVLLLL